jgi:SAM-dependent methyltransferase
VRARIVRDAGAGASRARNIGWRAARGTVVAFTDDDCMVAPDWLTAHLDALSEPAVVVSCGQVSGLPRYGGTATEVWDRTVVPARHGFGTPPWDIGHSANLAVRRAALAVVGGFDERLGPGARVPAGEDADLIVRLLRVGDARTGVGAPVQHLAWRVATDDARALVDYERGAGAWIGKLAVAHPRTASRLLRGRLRLLVTSSPWSDRRSALRHRAALARGVTRGLWLGIARPPGRDRGLSCEHSSPMTRSVDGMRTYWDTKAKENAAWYVDTSLSFDDPDMEQFWQQGERIVAIALDEPPAEAPAGAGLAVEIGSGLGRNCKAMTSRFDRVVGVDISPEMVRRAAELVPNAEFHLVDGASIAPVEDRTADLVFSFTVFQHIPDVAVIERYIAEAGRVLRPGGVFAFQWNNEPGHRAWRARRAWLTLLDRTGLRRERYGRHAPQFLGSKVPLERVERALTAAGLDLAATRGLGTLYAWAWARKK